VNYFIAELRRAAKRSPIFISEKKETHELIFSWLSWLAVLLVGARRTHDDDHGDDNDGVAQDGGRTPANSD